MKFALYILLCSSAIGMSGPFSEFAVTNVKSMEPDLDHEGNLVWQQWYKDGTEGDWDVHMRNLDADATSFAAVTWLGNQTNPSVYGSRIAFEDEYAADDHDIYVKDVLADLEPNTVAATSLDETTPAISGNTIAWQRLYVDDQTGNFDWDIMAADITDIGNPYDFSVALFEANQQGPAIYRDRVVWQDDYYGDWDITSSDIWIKDQPLEQSVSMTNQNQQQPAIWKNYVVWDEDFGGDYDIMVANTENPDDPYVDFITNNTAAQMNPDIYENIVVWQDYRNGNWDIYGYNLITKKEFQITNDRADQYSPTVGGGWVAWVDKRTGTELIYAAHITGAAAATCQNPPAGDLDGDCRTGLPDLVKLSEGWLACGLEPLEACVN